MFTLFCQSLGRFARVVIGLVTSGHTVRMPLRRRLAMMALIPPFALLQLVHWLGFMLDEVLFPSYRKVVVRRPLFVIGPPRSGTTFLHRVLAADRRYTTFSTWECLFAPSITERKIWMALGRLDRAVGGPFTGLVGTLTRRVTHGLDAVHQVALAEPEEDYLVFLPVFACFILALGAPHAVSVWRMGYFDRAVAAPQRRQLMAYYRRCLQKHLYVHGTGHTLLSKNASFPPLLQSLIETFPDARIICTMRDPMAVVPSQLSSVRAGLWGLDRQAVADFDQRMTRVLRFHYRNLFTVLATRPPWQQVIVPMERIKNSLLESVTGIYRRLEIPMDAGFLDYLACQEKTVRRYRSQHHYDLGQFGLTEAAIRARFRHAYRSYDFDRGAIRGATERPTPVAPPVEPIRAVVGRSAPMTPPLAEPVAP